MMTIGTRVAAAYAALTLIWIAPAGTPSRADELLVQPGVYEGLLLVGYDPTTKTVSGYFSEELGGGQFSCIFYLTGEVGGAAARIASYFPKTPRDRIAGNMTRGKDGQLAVSLVEEHGGCAMVEHFAEKAKPREFELSAAHPWMSIRVVKSKKAYFYNAPDSQNHRKAYLVQGNGVGVKSAKTGWLEVDYPGPEEKTTSGWMRETEFYPGP
jgi:hypothetical protein